jgi:hypothetical protein
MEELAESSAPMSDLRLFSSESDALRVVNELRVSFTASACAPSFDARKAERSEEEVMVTGYDTRSVLGVRPALAREA